MTGTATGSEASSTVTGRSEATGGRDEPREAIPYQYFVLQAMPRPERGECVNVAVVLYSEEVDTLILAWHVDEARLAALDPEVDVDSVRASLAFLSTWCDAPSRTVGRSAAPSAPPAVPGPVPEGRRPGARFGWLAAPRSSVLRPGPVHGGVMTGSARDEAQRLLDRLVRLPPR